MQKLHQSPTLSAANAEYGRYCMGDPTGFRRKLESDSGWLCTSARTEFP